LFVGANDGGDPQTSVAQALALMNGSVTNDATSTGTSARLQQLVAEHPESAERQIETLYLSTLSRQPTHEERQALNAFYGQGDEADRQRQLGDIFWMLLNSAEFCWNH
jgi:hypothetical protein